MKNGVHNLINDVDKSKIEINELIFFIENFIGTEIHYSLPYHLFDEVGFW